MDFREALTTQMHDAYRRAGRGVDGDYETPATTHKGLQLRMDYLEKRYGSKKAAASHAGISIPTWNRWRRTGPPARRTPQLLGLVDAVKSTRGPELTLTALRIALRSVSPTIKAVINWAGYYNRTPERTTTLDPLDLSQLATPWAKARGDQMEEAFYRAHERDLKARHVYEGKVRFEGNAVEVSW
jgi:hypothetical protein